MSNEQFILITESIYKQNPEMFGFAFWKYKELLRQAQVYEKIIYGIRYLYAIKDNKLIFYWSEDDRMILSFDELQCFDIIYVHSKYKDSLYRLMDTHEINSGVALIYNNEYVDKCNDNNYDISNFDFNSDTHFMQASDIINSTASNTIITPEYIKSFIKQPVYDKKLWVFVKDKVNDKPVAIGIAVYDKEICETELEWIYVDSAYHGRGIGKVLIHELIRRSQDMSSIIRVGGVANDFYIKCGFTIKTDEWLWVKKKDSNTGWWS